MRKIIVLVIAALVGGLLPIPVAKAAPAIQLLNPSTYNGAAPEISTKQDLDGNFHFVAWVPSVPQNAIVEFEIQSVAGNSLRTINASRVGADTFEGFDNLANLADGNYLVAALLYSNGDQVDEGIDRQAVSVRNGTLGQVETAEIVAPGNGGSLGFFTPKGLRPRALVDVATSDGARQVRVLVTKTRPGGEPEWVQCGTGTVSSQSARVRCTLPEGTEPAQVTAVAAVANQTPPPGPAQVPADDSGDAHRVTVYNAVPTRVSIDPEATRAEISTCSPEFRATVTDQLGRPLSAVNVDVHAVGPTDQLQFAAGGNAMQFQAPDKGPHSSEPTHRCTELDAEGRQGETNRIGANDEKHIESRSDVTNPGTNNQGAFIFRLYSDTVGGTEIIAWADADDDDVQQAAEASGGARLGWGQDPPAPTQQAFLEPSSGSATVGSCQRFVLTVKEGGNPAAGRNADAHISSADTTPSFCTPSEGSATRLPDQGEHVAGTHADGTKHVEGELDSQGRLIFGVTAPSEGRVVVQGWLDESDDDTLTSGEAAAGGAVSFALSGDRDVSLDSSRRAVRKGGRVRLFGAIDGSPSCAEGQVVKLRSRVPGKRFRTIGQKRTNGSGEYGFRVKVFKTKDYKVIAPRAGVCDKARSNTVRVRART